MVLPRKRGAEQPLGQRHKKSGHYVAGEDVGSGSSSSGESNVAADTNPMTLFHQWSMEEGQMDIVLHTLSFLDVTELVKKKQVCQKWQHLCTKAIDNKCTNPKNFKTNQELRKAVKEYCTNEPDHIEEIAISYGYPINKWKVQDLKDFSRVFEYQSALTLAHGICPVL